MELTPREIQDRLRSGATVEDVAAAAEVEIEHIAGFVAPIMAERSHISTQARQSHVRRAGESPAPMGLEDVVNAELQTRNLDPATVEWDATRIEPRRWQIHATVQDGQTERRGLFNYEVMDKFSVAANEDARWMLGEMPLPPADLETEPTIELTVEQRRANAQTHQAFLATTRSDTDESGDAWDDEDGFEDGDGGFEDGDTGLDALWDMMSSGYEETVAGYEDTLSILHRDLAEAGEDADEVDDDHDAPRAGGAAESEPDASGRTPPDQSRPASPDRSEPERPPREGTKKPRPAARRRSSRKRAQVPSWDEIMFGNTEGDKRP